MAPFAAVVEEREDVGIGQRGDGARLVFKPPYARLVSGKIGGQNLERDGATEANVHGTIDFAHPAGAEEDCRFRSVRGEKPSRKPQHRSELQRQPDLGAAQRGDFDRRKRLRYLQQRSAVGVGADDPIHRRGVQSVEHIVDGDEYIPRRCGQCSSIVVTP